MKPDDLKKDFKLMDVTEEQRNCKHINFAASVDVRRLTEDKTENTKVNGYVADIQINCAECGLPFLFTGLPNGISTTTPVANIDFSQATLPIIPVNKQYIALTDKVN